MNEVQITIGETFKWVDYMEMRQWCLDHIDADEYYVHPPKEALDQPARFQFYRGEDEFTFKMTFGVHDSDDTIDSATVQVEL